MGFHHISVLLEETINNLNVKPDGIYVDGTLGGGGHSEAICGKLQSGRLIGIDQDAAAIAAAGERLLPYGDKAILVRSNYEAVPGILKDLGIRKVDGILLDLGVSSYQLDTKERGFSYRSEDAPLDMRMDARQEFTARDLVNTYDEDRLYFILRNFGEERYARNIARRIVQERQACEITTTGQLNGIIRASIPKKAQAGGHPSKRTFQAIRIELNKELEVLQDSLSEMIGLLVPGGRICVITFHSLEDRIVKTIFKKAENPCTCPPDFPVCICGKQPQGKVISRKPLLPSKEEAAANPRAKSAKLRVFERS